MRSITSCTEGALHCSCTEGALHVPQGTLSFKTGGVSNYERSVGFASVQSLGAFIIRHPCLFVSALFAWRRATLCALTFRHPCLTRLCGFSHPHSNTQKAKTVPFGYGLRFLVPVAGVEPARYCYQRILSPSRLPIPSHRRILCKTAIKQRL